MKRLRGRWQMDKDSILNAYRQAYLDLHGRQPCITVLGKGWVSIDSFKYRITKVPRMTEMLVKRAKRKRDPDYKPGFFDRFN